MRHGPTLLVMIPQLAAMAACAASDAHERQDRLMLEVLRARLQGIEEGNLNFNESMLASRNQFFEWIKEPQARVRAGLPAREEDVNRMIRTYARWAVLADENGKWMVSQLDGLSRECDVASRMQWATGGNADEAQDLLTRANTMLESLREVVRLRRELANETRAEAEKLMTYKKTLFR